MPVAADAARTAPTPHPSRDATVPAAGKALPNPTLRLDPGLAIVVIEFRDGSGAVRSTIPTEQQLDAYRAWERGHVGATQAGSPAAATPPPATQATSPAAIESPAARAPPPQVGPPDHGPHPAAPSEPGQNTAVKHL